MVASLPVEVPAPSTTAPRRAVELDEVCVSFGGVRALTDISLTLEAGKIHAFVGQNGAGKSTCCGVIAGRVSPERGLTRVLGTDFPSNPTPRQAQRAGVATIWQELNILPEMSTLENVFLGQLCNTAGVVRRRQMLDKFEEISSRLRVSFGPNVRAGSLSMADRQMLEIMRALSTESRVLILDEPTATLSPAERAILFELMHELRDEGVCLIWVSHFLDEILEHSDNVVVFRDGRLVETRPTPQWSEEQLVGAMLGEERQILRAEASRTEAIDAVGAELLLAVEGLTNSKLNDVNLQLREGEIVGIAGLVGSGRSTLCRVLAGAQAGRAGRHSWAGEQSSLPRSPATARRRGIAFTSEDRKRDGLFPLMSGAENVTISNLAAVATTGVIGRRAVRRAARGAAEQFDLNPVYLKRPAKGLSGGNQQKLLLARSAVQQPRLLIADEPTRGIDIGAKAQIMVQLRRFTESGGTVLFVSSDLEEVAALADRVYVLRNGAIQCELPAQHGRTEKMLNAAFGVNKP